jgi:hypothetical protein
MLTRDKCVDPNIPRLAHLSKRIFKSIRWPVFSAICDQRANFRISVGRQQRKEVRMHHTPTPFAAAAALLIMCSVASAKTEYLQNVPKDGEIPYGKTVYVDDKKCPKGEVKEIIGGSQEKSIPRKTRCVKRPRD